MKNRLFVGLLSSVLLGGFSSFAQETNTVVGTNTLYIRDALRVPDNFFERYVTYAGEHGRLNFFQDLVLPLYPDPFAYSGDQINSLGEDVVWDSFADAGRQMGEESAGYFFFRGVYESWSGNLGSFFSDRFKKVTSVFVRNTINGTAEEALDNDSLAIQPSKESWIQKLKDDGDYSYGLRPGSSPYFFFSTHIQSKGRELAFINMRCYYRKLESLQARFLVSVPLSKRWSVDTSFVYTPTDESEKYGTVSVGVVRLERRISNHGFFFIGEQISKENTTLIGFSREW